MESLEQVLVNRLNEIHFQLFKTLYTTFDADEFSDIVLPKYFHSKDYTQFRTDEWANVLKMFGSVVMDHKKDYEEVLKECKKSKDEVRKDINIQFSYIKKSGISISLSDDEQSFHRKNNNHELIDQNSPNYQPELDSTLVDFIENVVFLYQRIDEQVSDTIKGCGTLLKITSDLKELETNVSLVRQVKDKYGHVPAEKTTYCLRELFGGKVNRSRFFKMMNEDHEGGRDIQNNQHNEQIPDIEPLTNKEKQQQEYIKKEYDLNDLEFLMKRGIKQSRAKEIIDYYKFKTTKGFITTVESVFEKYNIDQKEIFEIYKRFPNVLDLDNGESAKYIDAIEALLTLYAPSKVSGILPRYADYSSADKILEYRSDDKKKILFEGIDIIKRKKDKDNFIEWANNSKTAPLLTKPIAKRLTCGSNDEKHYKPLYRYCLEKERELYGGDNVKNTPGIYQKNYFGERRALFKVFRNRDDSFTVRLIDYFENHPHYDRAYGNR